jgi:hypothetical protein
MLALLVLTMPEEIYIILQTCTVEFRLQMQASAAGVVFQVVVGVYSDPKMALSFILSDKPPGTQFTGLSFLF